MRWKSQDDDGKLKTCRYVTLCSYSDHSLERKQLTSCETRERGSRGRYDNYVTDGLLLPINNLQSSRRTNKRIGVRALKQWRWCGMAPTVSGYPLISSPVFILLLPLVLVWTVWQHSQWSRLVSFKSLLFPVLFLTIVYCFNKTKTVRTHYIIYTCVFHARVRPQLWMCVLLFLLEERGLRTPSSITFLTPYCFILFMITYLKKTILPICYNSFAREIFILRGFW